MQGDRSNLEELVQQAKKGDLGAFGEIYDQFHNRIYFYVLRQVGSAADAEDITAEVFLDVLENICSYKNRGSGFTPWLFRIARNDVIDYFRRRQLRTRKANELVRDLQQTAVDSKEDYREEDWDDRELQLAFRRLPREQQQVLFLRLNANLSSKEVGEVLSKSEGAIKALQHRALTTLKKLMEHKKDV
ncbi:MAG: RNA polymerase sigma factor [Thermoleophilia bacterium]